MDIIVLFWTTALLVLLYTKLNRGEDEELVHVDGIWTSHEKKLAKTLLANYEQRGIYGRPVQNFNDVITIYYAINLIQIMDLDEKNQVLTVNVWDKYTWHDIFLVWTPEDHGNVTEVRVPSERIWTPDIKLYNYADDRIQEHRQALAVVSYDGSILWMPQAIYKSSCAINIVDFPFDKQKCRLKFGSWTYNGLKLDIKFNEGLNAFDMSDYMVNKEWEITKNFGIRNVIKYSCCKEIFPDLTFTVHLSRRAIIYNYILILPCVLLSILTLVLFWIPPESPAKMQLGMNIFVAFFVLLLLLEESLPSAASSIPLIGAYYCLNMVMITLSSFLNVLVVNLAMYGARGPVPNVVRKIFIDFFGRVLCVNRPPAYTETQKTPDATTQRERPLIVTKFEMADGCGKWTSEPWRASTEQLLPPNGNTPTHIPRKFSDIYSDSNIRLIAEVARHWMQKQTALDNREKMGKEWKCVAIALDRLFFLSYLLTIIVTLATIFPRSRPI